MDPQLHPEAQAAFAHPDEALIRQQFEPMFAQELDRHLDSLRHEQQAIVSRGIIGQQTAERIIRQHEAYREFDMDQKINWLLNNFHCWLSTGHYRDSQSFREPEAAAQAQRLTVDLDSLIAQTGYEPLLSTVHDEKQRLNPTTHEQKLALADLFLRLLKQGYDYSLLIG